MAIISIFSGNSGVTCRYSETKHQVSLKLGSGCPDGTIQSKSELWCNTTSSEFQASSDANKPHPTSRHRGHKPPPEFGEASVVWVHRPHNELGRSFRDRRNRYDVTAFRDTDRTGPKTTTLRKRIRESQASNISPTSSPPKGATKLQRCCPLEIGVRLWEFLFPRARTCHRISWHSAQSSQPKVLCLYFRTCNGWTNKGLLP